MNNYEIFISYSSKDINFVEELGRSLSAQGVPAWYAAKDIKPGQNYQEAVVTALEKAPKVILVYSANAQNSDEIKRELSIASRLKKSVIPIRIDESTPTGAYEYELATRQWINCFNVSSDLPDVIRQIIQVMPSTGVNGGSGENGTEPEDLEKRISKTKLGIVISVIILSIFLLCSYFFYKPPGPQPHPDPHPDIIHPTPAEPVVKPQVAPEVKEETCINVQVESPLIVPYRLMNIVGRKEFPFWFRVDAVNNCKTTRHLKIRLKSEDGVQFHKELASFTLGPGERSLRMPDPKIRFTGKIHEPTKLTFSYTILDQNNKIIKIDTRDITVSAPDTYYWNLTKSDGSRVPHKFTAASLSFWTQGTRKTFFQIIKKWQAELDVTPDFTADAYNWFSLVYRELFMGEAHKISWASFTTVFPPEEGLMDLASPEDVLSMQNSVIPLEVGLAITAVSRVALKHLPRLRLLLVILPPMDHAENTKDVLVGWKTGNSEWFAVDCSGQTTNMKFTDNTASASTRLQHIMNNQEISTSIEESGVYRTKNESMIIVDPNKSLRWLREQ